MISKFALKITISHCGFIIANKRQFFYIKYFSSNASGDLNSPISSQLFMVILNIIL